MKKQGATSDHKAKMIQQQNDYFTLFLVGIISSLFLVAAVS